MAEHTPTSSSSPLDPVSLSIGARATPAAAVEAAIPPRPWAMPATQGLFLALALGSAALALLMRLLYLRSFQDEAYGDINIVLTYVRRVVDGERPFYFELSAGPLYHYTIAPLVALAGPSYYSLKLASVLVSLATLLATYALARRLVDDHFALLATCIAGVSSWLLVFSRLGNSQIMVPLLSTAALWLGVRYAQEGRRRDIVACAVVSALGLYVYPQSFIIAGVLFATLICLRLAGQPIRTGDLLLFAGVALVVALPFAQLVLRDPANFIDGYIGGKLGGDDGGSAVQRLATNTVNALLAFNVRGDENFRSNPSNLPHLDPLSGLLFLAGIVYWLLPGRRRWGLALLVPFLLLQLPSILVLSSPREVPSAARSLAVAPLAYIFAASGLWWLLAAVGRLRQARILGAGLLGLALAAILLLNAQRYFQTYAAGLPYQNTHIGGSLVSYMDLLPPETAIYLVGCCWESGMPEPEGMVGTMRNPASFNRFEPAELSCDTLRFLAPPAVLIWSYHDPLPAPQLAECADWLPGQLYSSPGGLPMFYAAPLAVGREAPPAADGLPALPGDESLVFSNAQIGGEAIAVRHSPIDIGSLPDLFDNNPGSLIRGASDNPLVIELRFPEPRSLSGVTLDLGTMRSFQVTIEAVAADGAVQTATGSYQDLPPDPRVELDLSSGPAEAEALRVVISDLGPTPADGWHIHVRGLELR